ncbi:MAG: hypothetical protein M1840_000347 [Geoglossum simile]|nr:MAG: hypothetical protein M1840_000347 [Geoglossum simile]
MATIQPITLPSILNSYLKLHTDIQVLLCLNCQNAILPSSIKLHLSRNHRLHKDIVHTAQEFAKTLPPYTNNTLPLPSDRSTPIENWPVYDGYHCRCCNFRSRHPQIVFDHAAKEHNMKNRPKEERLYSIQLQSWFSNSRARYWTISREEIEDIAADEAIQQDEEENIVSQDLKADILRQEMDRLAKIEERRQVLGINERVDNKDYWLIRTGWQRLFAGRNMQTISDYRLPPTHNEYDLIWVCQIFDQVILRAMHTVQDTPREILRWVMSPKLEEIHVRPFSILEGEGTVDGYIGFWRSFLCYCFRTIQLPIDEQREQHGIQYTAKQTETLHRIRWLIKELPQPEDHKHKIMARYTGRWECPALASNEEETELIEGIETEIMQFCLQVLQHRFQTGAVHENPLIFFTAVLGIDEKTMTLRSPQFYTRFLAGLVWVNKLLLLEYALPSKAWPNLKLPARDEYPDFGIRLAEVRGMHLVDGSYSPQSEILSLLAYGQFVAKQTGGRTVLSWTIDRQTVSIYGNPISMDRYRKFPITLIAKATHLLYEVLMFGKQPTVNLECIQDSMTYGIAGYWYGNLPANKLDIGMGYVLEAALVCMQEQRLFKKVKINNRKGHELKWHDVQRNRYLRHATSFKEILFLLMHVTGGQPARGPEIGSVKICNTARTARNIFVLDGMVLFTTEYDKKRDTRLTTRYIVRYLPDTVGQLLVTYQVYLLPFLDFVTNSISESVEANDYLFGNTSIPWTGRKLTTILKCETASHFGVTMGVSKWRQITIGIAKEHLPEIAHTMQRYNDDDYESDEEEEIDLLHEQAGHGRRMGIMHYGQDANFLSQLQPELLAELRKLSIHWHQFLGLAPTSLPKRKRAVSTIDQVVTSTPKLSSRVRQRNDSFVATVDVLQDQMHTAMIRLYGVEAQFRSAAQEQAMKAVLRNDKSSIIVMGTAEGKSTLFMVPAVMSGAGTVIVIVPFRALVDDLVRRSIEFGIDAIEWTPGLMHPHVLVIVSADIAINNAFMHYATTLKDKQLLRHIFLDECHTAFTDIDYREALRSLSRIRDLNVPLTLLTATLPPVFEWDLRQAMLIHNATLLRFLTHRPTISYQVTEVKAGKTVTVAIKLCQDMSSKMSATEKGIIYCRSRNKCQALAKLLSCPFYLSGGDDNQAALTDWQSDTNIHWIVATGALGTGIDMGGVVGVVHVDRPYGLIDMVQQAGRGGRNGQESSAIVIIDPHSIDAKAHNIGKSLNRFRNIDEEWLQKYLTTSECRRLIIGEYMDNNAATCSDLDGSPCDICRMKTTMTCTELAPHRNLLAECEHHRQQVIEWLYRFTELCVYCLIQNIPGHQTHNYSHCTACIEEMDFTTFHDWRRQLRFLPYKNCNWCGLPQSYCTRQHDLVEGISMSQDCKWPDIVLAIIFIGWRNGELLRLINDKFSAQVQDDRQLREWLSGEDLWEGEEKSHIMMVFETVGPMLLEIEKDTR